MGYSTPGGAATVRAGQPATIRLGVVPAEAGTITARWTAGGSGLVVAPTSGEVTIGSSSTGPATKGPATCAPAATGTRRSP